MMENAPKLAVIDQMDGGMDLLRTVWIALHAPSMLTDDVIDALANTLNLAINTLEPVRAAVNKAHGEERI